MATYNITANNLSGAGIFNIFAVPDSSAQDFINATGIADTIQQNAICDLVRDLKNYGLWSKMKAVYPFVTDNRNLLSYTTTFINPNYQTDSTATFTLNNTTAPDGSNTGVRFTAVGSNSNYFYSANTIGGNNFGAGNKVWSIYVKAGTFSGSASIAITSDGSNSASVIALTNDWQRITVTKNVIVAGNNSQYFIDMSGISMTSGQYFYIWAPQFENGTTATTYQPIATTPQAYIASQFKFNLKDPRDLDAAYRLVFNGGWTFDKTGATPNGTNGYADTKFNPSLNGQLNSAHLSYYSRTNNSTNNQIEIGANAPAHFLCYRFDSSFAYHGINSLDTPSTPFTPSTGLFVGSRINSTTGKFYTNGSLALTDNKASTSRPNQNISLGALNNNGTQAYFTTKQSAFATIGDGLSDTEAANLYIAVQAFQTSLSRQV